MCTWGLPCIESPLVTPYIPYCGRVIVMLTLATETNKIQVAFESKHPSFSLFHQPKRQIATPKTQQLAALTIHSSSYSTFTSVVHIADMSLQSLYQSFLAAPSAGALAEGASLNYITTLTTINEPAAIIKHLTTQQLELKKKQERVISAIESSDAICLDVETTLEFVSSGGAYLPGLDDNFLADRVVTFPLVSLIVLHSYGVSFDILSTGAYRALQCAPEDSASPLILGPRVVTETCGCHRSSGTELANP